MSRPKRSPRSGILERGYSLATVPKDLREAGCVVVAFANFAPTVRPFDTDGLVRALARPDVVLIEPYIEGTSARLVSEALAHTPRRLLSIDLPCVELKKYGTPEEHDRALGLTTGAIGHRIMGFSASPSV